MPIPKPNSGEERNDFINRCMADATMCSEYGRDQRIAVCSTAWRDRNKNKENEEN